MLEHFDSWMETISIAEKFEPQIDSALSPIFDRLTADSPQNALPIALAVICNALRRIAPAGGGSIEQCHREVCEVAVAAVRNKPNIPPPFDPRRN